MRKYLIFATSSPSTVFPPPGLPLISFAEVTDFLSLWVHYTKILCVQAK